MVTEAALDYGVPHLFGPRERRCPRFGGRFADGRAARDQQLHQLLSAPAAGPAKWRGLQQVVAEVEPCAPIEQHRDEAGAVRLLLNPAARGGEMQDGLAETRHVDVDSMPQQQRHARQAVLSRLGRSQARVVSQTPNRLDQDPVPPRVAGGPVQVR
jgi:hypothetical protein